MTPERYYEDQTWQLKGVACGPQTTTVSLGVEVIFKAPLTARGYVIHPRMSHMTHHVYCIA